MAMKWLAKARLPDGVRYTPVDGTEELEVTYKKQVLGICWPVKGDGWRWVADMAGETPGTQVATSRNRAFEELCKAHGHELKWGHGPNARVLTELPKGWLLKPGALRVLNPAGGLAGWVVSADEHGTEWVPAASWGDIPDALQGDQRFACKEAAVFALQGVVIP